MQNIGTIFLEVNLKLSNETLLNLALNDFDQSIEQMDAAQLRHHLREAFDSLRSFLDQLEDISYQMAEHDKHGWVKF